MNVCRGFLPLATLTLSLVACTQGPRETTVRRLPPHQPLHPSATLGPGPQTAPPATPPDESAPTSAGGRCPACGLVMPLATLADEEIDEASGIAASSRSPDLFYLHNDSGDRARFFAVDRRGATRATFEVQGVFALDWEDMARGPCKGGSCLLFGDIGDNLKFRRTVPIYRVTEPDPASAGAVTVTAESMQLTYPDGPHNAEALLVHPLTGAITIVAKTSHAAVPVFDVAGGFVAGGRADLVAEPAITLPAGAGSVTAGDVHPSARGVLLRTPKRVLYYPMAAGQSVAQALSGEACELPTFEDGNGEAIGFRSDGAGYVLAGEGVHPTLRTVSCTGM